MPDFVWVSVSGRPARLAGRGPPEGSGNEWQSEHVTAIPPCGPEAEKRGESPISDMYRVTWFISSWRSDGAPRGEALPRVKVGARTVRVAKDPLRTRPRRATSPRWRARSGRRRCHGEADPSPHLPTWLRPDQPRDHAPPENGQGPAAKEIKCCNPRYIAGAAGP